MCRYSTPRTNNGLITMALRSFRLDRTNRKIKPRPRTHDRHYYSVPHMLVKTQVEVRATSQMMNVYAGGRRVACHLRSNQQAGHSTLKEHMPQSHRHQADWTPQRFEQWAADIGPSTLHVVKTQLYKKRHPEQSFRSVMALLQLAKQYDRVRLERACTRAIEIGSPTRTSVQSTDPTTSHPSCTGHGRST